MDSRLTVESLPLIEVSEFHSHWLRLRTVIAGEGSEDGYLSTGSAPEPVDNFPTGILTL